MTQNVNDVRTPDQWVTYPPIVPLETASSLVLTPPWNYNTTDPVGPPRDALSSFFCKPLPSWLTENDVGGVTDLVAAHGNVAIASIVLESMFGDYMQVCRARNHPPSRRMIIAVRLVSYGAHQVSAAHVMHLRDEAFYQVGALSLARTAIELVARGGWVAIGEGNEPDKVVYGPRLPTHRERRQHEVNTTDCMTAIERKARRAWPEADLPLSVYRYLNQFTHFDGRVIDLLGATDERDALRVSAYAATAYVAWLAAAMAGVILGRETAAKAPRLPSAVPWRTPSGPTA